MRRMPRRDTHPEVALRRALHARGLRFRKNYGGLPGRPDIVFTRARLAVFVDGCFWHRCPEHFHAPKANAEWWRAKFDSVVARDADTAVQLQAAGWLPVVVWQHEDMREAARRLQLLDASRRGRRSAGPRP